MTNQLKLATNLRAAIFHKKLYEQLSKLTSSRITPGKRLPLFIKRTMTEDDEVYSNHYLYPDGTVLITNRTDDTLNYYPVVTEIITTPQYLPTAEEFNEL